MGTKVDLDRLATALEDYSYAYLMTTGEPPLEPFTAGPLKVPYKHGRPVLERRLQRLSRRQYREAHLE